MIKIEQRTRFSYIVFTYLILIMLVLTTLTTVGFSKNISNKVVTALKSKPSVKTKIVTGARINNEVKTNQPNVTLISTNVSVSWISDINRTIKRIAPHLSNRVRSKIVRALRKKVNSRLTRPIKARIIKRFQPHKLRSIREIRRERKLLVKEWRLHKKAINAYNIARARWMKIENSCKNNQTPQEKCFEVAKNFSLRSLELLIKRLEIIKEKISNKTSLEDELEIDNKIDALKELKQQVIEAENIDELREAVRAAKQLAEECNRIFKELYSGQVLHHLRVIVLQQHRIITSLKNRIKKLNKSQAIDTNTSDMLAKIETIEAKLIELEQYIESTIDSYKDDELNQEQLKETIIDIKNKIETISKEIRGIVKEFLIMKQKIKKEKQINQNIEIKPMPEKPEVISSVDNNTDKESKG